MKINLKNSDWLETFERYFSERAAPFMLGMSVGIVFTILVMILCSFVVE